VTTYEIEYPGGHTETRDARDALDLGDRIVLVDEQRTALLTIPKTDGLTITPEPTKENHPS
jgi:hypothetical protein